jgi:hypothetical protein
MWTWTIPASFHRRGVPGKRSGERAAAPPGFLETLTLVAAVTDRSGMGDELASAFEGPFVVTCSVPASILGGGAPVAEGDAPTLVVDEGFESALCKPYARLQKRATPLLEHPVG